MTSLIRGKMVTLQYVSCGKRAQTYCMNFILQATNAQGIGTRLGFSLASQTQPTLSRITFSITHGEEGSGDAQ